MSCSRLPSLSGRRASRRRGRPRLGRRASSAAVIVVPMPEALGSARGAGVDPRFASWMIDRSRASGRREGRRPRGIRETPPLRGGRRPRPPVRRPCRRRRRRAAGRRRTRPRCAAALVRGRSGRRPGTSLTTPPPARRPADPEPTSPSRSRSAAVHLLAVQLSAVRGAEVDDPDARLAAARSARGARRRTRRVGKRDDVLSGATDGERGVPSSNVWPGWSDGAGDSTTSRHSRPARPGARAARLGGSEDEALLRQPHVPAGASGRRAR